MRWLDRWLQSKRGAGLTVPITVTGAENDPCQHQDCGVRRKDHSFAVQKHHFKEEAHNG